MKIGIDLVSLKTYSFKRGVGKYVYNLIRKLLQIDNINLYVLFNVPNELLKEFEYKNVIIFEREPNIHDTENMDIFLFSNLLEFNINNIPNLLDIKCKKALIFYDLIPVLFWEQYMPGSEYFKKIGYIKHFDIVFAISNSTKKDLIEILDIPDEKIYVIYAGLDENYLRERSSIQDIQEVKNKYQIKRNYLLSTPGFDFRKNIQGLFEAFSLLSDEWIKNFDLILVCNLQPSEKQHLLNIWAEMNLPQDHLILTNYIPIDDLIALYDGAKIFVFPSLYEGFGLPVLESMSRGCPVVTSNISSIPEVSESAAILVNPNSSRDISSAIENLLQNDHLREKLITLGYQQSKKFSWTRVAVKVRETFEAFDQNVSDKSLKTFPRYKIAFFSPLNPVKSGISDYSELLLTGLKEWFDIDIFIDSDYTPNNPLIRESFKVYSHINFESEKNNYDLIVYQVGNSGYHLYMLDYILKYPGFVVLHDLTIINIIILLCQGKINKNFDQQKYLEYVFENYGYSKCLQVQNKFKLNKSIDVFDLSLNFVKIVIDSSYLTIVHNKFSKKYLEETISYSNIFKINMGLPSPRYKSSEKESLKIELGIPDVLIVSAIGRITVTKRIDVLLSSFSMIVNTYNIKDIHLNLVGSLEPSVKEEVERKIQEGNLQEYVTITGFISEDEFERYYAITDIFVNLRYPSSGETSSTLIKALSYGLPIITSNFNQYNEYPQNCVWKVDISFNEVEVLTEYLLELIHNKQLRAIMSENSLNYARNSHSFSTMLFEYASLIDHAIKYKHQMDNLGYYV